MTKQTIDGIDYYERVDDAHEAHAVRVPQGYPNNGPAKVLAVVHGMGERSAGSIENLKNVVLGFDYDGAGPLPRQYAIMTPESVANADATNTILVIVTYPTEFNPNDFGYVLDNVEANYQVDKTREFIIGFSLGGGAILRYVTSSVAAAGRLAGAFACAPVNWATNLQNVVDAKLQLVGVTCEIDPTVPASNIKSVISNLNKLNPEFPGYLHIFPGTAHSGMAEMLAGQGPQSMWDYMNKTSTVNRRKYPTDITKPIDPVVVPPPIGATAAFTTALNGSEILLDASISTGAVSYFWDVTPDYTLGKPGSWGLRVEGGAAGGPKKRVYNMGEGDYSVTLTINGNVKSDTRRVTIKTGNTEPVPKPVPKSILMSDGSMVTTGWKLTSPTGETYSL